MKRIGHIGWALSITMGVVALLCLTLLVLFWYQSLHQNDHLFKEIFVSYGHYFLAACLALLICLGFFLARIFWRLVVPMQKISEEAALIFSANPSHRIQLDGALGLEKVIHEINVAAEKYQTLEKSVFRRVQVAKADLEEEKNILAAIMAELPDAVLICNKESRIILYNSQAKRFFGQKNSTASSLAKTDSIGQAAPSDRTGKVTLGIGRPISDFVGENSIRHALQEIHLRLEKGQENVSSNFVITDKANRLLRAEASPILNPHRDFSGFIVIFSDITQELRSEARGEFLLRTFQQKIRHSVASIKSAIEIICAYPDTASARQHRLMKIIQSESQSLEQLIQQSSKDTFRQTRKQWPMMPVSIGELLEVLQKNAEEKLDIQLTLALGSEKYWVKVDTYALSLVLLFFLERVKGQTGIRRFNCRLGPEDEFIFFDFIWEGSPVTIGQLRQWETMQLDFMEERMPLHLREVLEHHNAEIWPYADNRQEKRSCLRVYLPRFRPQAQEAIRKAPVLPDSRPEFYEFDLFHQPGQSENLDTRALRDLSYTVFDTETTGLDPLGGDEIVSIGAYRIVNGRIRTKETFDQLINPNRTIPMSATQIHGITNEMVQTRPAIDDVLPSFHKYSEDTILIAHNAAFDMRMLQMYEKKTGIQFVNPVLDTLLLSAIVHSAQEDQTLSSIANRLGVSVRGRHTAMGDAMMTAEIFLKLIPLLEKIGIRSLGEARAASEKTYYARLTF